MPDEANLRDVEVLRPAGGVMPVRLLPPYATEHSITGSYDTRDLGGALQLVQRAAAGSVAQLQ